MTPKNKGNTMF